MAILTRVLLLALALGAVCAQDQAAAAAAEGGEAVAERSGENAQANDGAPAAPAAGEVDKDKEERERAEAARLAEQEAARKAAEEEAARKAAEEEAARKAAEEEAARKAAEEEAARKAAEEEAARKAAEEAPKVHSQDTHPPENNPPLPRDHMIDHARAGDEGEDDEEDAAENDKAKDGGKESSQEEMEAAHEALAKALRDAGWKTFDDWDELGDAKDDDGPRDDSDAAAAANNNSIKKKKKSNPFADSGSRFSFHAAASKAAAAHKAAQAALDRQAKADPFFAKQDDEAPLDPSLTPSYPPMPSGNYYYYGGRAAGYYYGPYGLGEDDDNDAEAMDDWEDDEPENDDEPMASQAPRLPIWKRIIKDAAEKRDSMLNRFKDAHKGSVKRDSEDESADKIAQGYQNVHPKADAYAARMKDFMHKFEKKDESSDESPKKKVTPESHEDKRELLMRQAQAIRDKVLTGTRSGKRSSKSTLIIVLVACSTVAVLVGVGLFVYQRMTADPRLSQAPTVTA